MKTTDLKIISSRKDAPHYIITEDHQIQESYLRV